MYARAFPLASWKLEMRARMMNPAGNVIPVQVPEIPVPAMLVSVPDSANWIAVKDPV